MALPEAIARQANRQVQAFCDTRVPAELRDQIQLEFSVRGNSITIVERRPPWRDDLGPVWSSTKVAQLRFDPAAQTWALYCSNSSGRWFRYDGAEPSRDVRPLFDEIDADPTGIFWG